MDCFASQSFLQKMENPFQASVIKSLVQNEDFQKKVFNQPSSPRISLNPFLRACWKTMTSWP